MVSEPEPTPTEQVQTKLETIQTKTAQLETLRKEISTLEDEIAGMVVDNALGDIEHTTETMKGWVQKIEREPYYKIRTKSIVE